MDLDKRLYKLQTKLDCIQRQLANVRTNTISLKHISYTLSVLAYREMLKDTSHIFSDQDRANIKDKLNSIMRWSK